MGVEMGTPATTLSFGKTRAVAKLSSGTLLRAKAVRLDITFGASELVTTLIVGVLT